MRVIDGDTIDIGADATVRLLAIDAPEMDQTCRTDDGALIRCGEIATRAARDLLEGERAVCEVRGRDRYDRYLATCTVDGADIGRRLVLAGIARTYGTDPTYDSEQKAAAIAGRGLWAHGMDNPALWRATHRASSGQSPPTPGCAIKGNVSASGRIYHLPGGRYYAHTRISAQRGERWFCSEQDARAAGWRAPRR